VVAAQELEEYMQLEMQEAMVELVLEVLEVKVTEHMVVLEEQLMVVLGLMEQNGHQVQTMVLEVVAVVAQVEVINQMERAVVQAVLMVLVALVEEEVVKTVALVVQGP
jgi:hypothetical protein